MATWLNGEGRLCRPGRESGNNVISHTGEGFLGWIVGDKGDERGIACRTVVDESESKAWSEWVVTPNLPGEIQR
jgi:hypothetical protein